MGSLIVVSLCALVIIGVLAMMSVIVILKKKR